jgi:glycosyltransferase involved in cell wall biosynthesis
VKRKLIIGIDTSRSAREKPTGVEQYSTSIISALLPELKDEELRLYTPEWISAFPRKLQRRIPGRRLWTLLKLSREMLRAKPDVLFVPAHVLPFFAPKASFVTIHDVAFEKIPEAYSRKSRRYLRWSTQRAVRKAQKVIVPTESVKMDLIEWFGAEPEKVLVVSHGVTPLPGVKPSEVKDFYQRYELDPKEPLFFFLGRLESKKNLLTLVEAWSIVQKMYSKGRLVLAGGSGHGYEEIQARIEELGLSGSVLTPGYVSESDAACLFHAATCFVYPSREEGFGLPVLQAFEAGCLVIASDIPPLREVAGNAALFADPGYAKDFAEQMMLVLEDAKLRTRLKAAAHEQLKKFSWKKAAKVLAFEFRESSLQSGQ